MGKSIGTIVQVVGTVAGVATGNPALIAGANAAGSYLSGREAASAAKDASNAQIRANNEAIARQEEQQKQARADLQPYQDAGAQTAPGLTKLVNDPQTQASFLQANPFYETLKEDAKNKLFANQAAKGKLGTGGTAEALQNSYLLLGESLLNNDVARKQTLVNTGQTAASQAGALNQNSTNQISGLIGDRGNAQASGIIGASNARTAASQDISGGLTELTKLINL